MDFLRELVTIGPKLRDENDNIRLRDMTLGPGRPRDQILERKAIGAGERIFREGDRGDRAYVIQQGSVEIYKEVDGQEVVLGTVKKGGIFGEMALLDDQPRMAGARAAEPTVVIIVSRTMFQQKLSKVDPFIRGLINIFANNIRNMAKNIGK